MHSILFASKHSAVLPGIAVALAHSPASNSINAEAAAGTQIIPSKALKNLLKQYDIKWPDEIQNIGDIEFRTYDLVICFTNKDKTFYPTLPGMPPLICWDITLPEKIDKTAYSDLFDSIKIQVETLLNQGYLNALVQARKNAELVLDNLHEGILAHDMGRRIFFFNKAAEQITGFKRKDVLGKDCHEIFADGFCGDQCSFCDGHSGLKIKTPTSNYSLEIKNQYGEKKLLEMTLVTLKNFLGGKVGVVASFRDTTREHEIAAKLIEIDQFAGIIGRDAKMQELFQIIGDLAKSKAAVLIQGESGTGKELVAAAIHNEGPRRNQLFVPVNCGALPENLLESELFGHVRGAFTGAIRDKKGRFELAHKGTLFLDEIGDISPSMQVKLLRVLQDGTFQRVGDEKILKTDVRLLSATHKNLKKEIIAGNFREDLFYRLCVVPLTLPPLRERRNDIPLLTRNFLKRFLKEENRQDIIIAPETMQLLVAHDWPGNVRELQNIIRFLLVRCREGLIRPHHLPPNLQATRKTLTIGKRPKKRGKLQEDAVIMALNKTSGNRLQAAKILGVSRATLYRFLDHTPVTP